MESNTYTYSTQPHAAPQRRKTPFREDENSGNLMNDPRVVRGSTYSANVNAPKPPSDHIVPKSGSNLYGTKGKSTYRSKRAADATAGTDAPQEDYLEELTNRAIEIDVDTNTSAILERPPSPLFVRAKIGKDVETQIENGDLFDFDVEVTPLLEVLVGKTLHVSMLELKQEEELEEIHAQQVEFEAIRNTELAECQRFENEGRRLQKERERRAEQEMVRSQEKLQLKEKIAARSFAQQYLATLHEGLFDTLEEQGFFFDPVEKEIVEEYVGPLLTTVIGHSGNNEAAKSMADELLEAAMEKMIEMGNAGQAKREEEDKIAEKEKQLLLIKKEQQASAKRAADAAAAIENGEEPPASE